MAHLQNRASKRATLSGVAIAALAAVLLLSDAPAQAGENGWSYYPRWEDGCFITYAYVPVRTTISGKPGPAGYRRYELRGDVHFCLPD